MKAVAIRFPGQVLERGFWIYVVDVRATERRVLYVGRTGDSSSPNASSPFSRIGQHLDLRANAKGNALLRNLQRAGLNVAECALQMICVGPLFPEQSTFESHRPFRDQMAALEADLAASLRGRGHEVLGTHSAREQADAALLQQVLGLVERELVGGDRSPASPT